MRIYIADCKGFSTGRYQATSDMDAVRYARDWARDTWRQGIDGILEVWDVDADTLVRAYTLEEALKS